MSDETTQQEQTTTEEEKTPYLDIVKALGDHILEARRSWDKDGRIYASDLGLALGPEHAGCQAAFWHKCRNAPTKDVTPGRLLLLQAGDLLHDWVSDALKMALPVQGWRVVKVEEKVYLDHDSEEIGSRLDVLIEHIESGWRTVIDVKTKRGNAFSYLDEVKPGDELQVQGYIKAADADDGWVLYVDREGQNFMRAFHVPREDHRPETAIEILRDIRDNPEPPEPVGLRLTRKKNKGPDSLYIGAHWAIDWCDLQECQCKKMLGITNIPKKIVGKVKEKEDHSEVTITDEGVEFTDHIMRLLQEDYPDEEFRLVSRNTPDEG